MGVLCRANVFTVRLSWPREVISAKVLRNGVLETAYVSVGPKMFKDTRSDFGHAGGPVFVVKRDEPTGFARIGFSVSISFVSARGSAHPIGGRFSACLGRRVRRRNENANDLDNPSRFPWRVINGEHIRNKAPTETSRARNRHPNPRKGIHRARYVRTVIVALGSLVPNRDAE